MYKTLFRALQLIWRRAVLLPILSAAVLAVMCFEVQTTIHAQQQGTTQAILSIRVDDLKGNQDDMKAAISALTTTVQEERDKQNQMQGMLIGFGGFACLLQVLNTVLQFRGSKKVED